jgi:hypothetical protein
MPSGMKHCWASVGAIRTKIAIKFVLDNGVDRKSLTMTAMCSAWMSEGVKKRNVRGAEQQCKDWIQALRDSGAGRDQPQKALNRY